MADSPDIGGHGGDIGIRQRCATLGWHRNFVIARVRHAIDDRFLERFEAAVTSRNQPSNTKFIFGPARWMRGLIKPPEGCGLAYIDFASQEIGIAAALSGDERMADVYREGDPYLAFAKAAQLVPADATKTTHKLMRERCKAVVLGINYGMGPEAMALQAGITPAEAKELLRLHNETYRPFWRWIGDTVSSAMLTNKMQTVFG